MPIGSLTSSSGASSGSLNVPVPEERATTDAQPQSISGGSGGSGNAKFKAWWDGYKDPNGKYTGADLTRITMRELSYLPASFYEITPKDYKTWCPAFPKLSAEQRKGFYLGLISGIARYESDFRANVKYLEAGGHYSRGILQLGQLALSYYPKSRCDVSGDPTQLHDVSENLTCGVMLVKHWVTKDLHVAKKGNNGTGDGRYYGAARYWSTLREGRRGYSEIGAYTRKLPVCQ